MRDLQIDHDLFFISESFYLKHLNELKNMLVIPKSEYKVNSMYSNVVSNSNHGSWHIDYDYVIAAPELWYEGLNGPFQTQLRDEVINNKDMLVHHHQLVTKNYWKQLNDKEKIAFIQQFDDPLNDINIQEIAGFEHIKKYHNQFPERHGANCFASTAYAVTQNDDLILQWIHSKSLLMILDRYGYELSNEKEMESKDIMAFYTDEQLTHTCYVLDEKYCFNKSGQTFWEHWEINLTDEVITGRPEKDYKVFKRIKSL